MRAALKRTLPRLALTGAMAIATAAAGLSIPPASASAAPKAVRTPVAQAPAVQAPDPSAPGPYKVETATYNLGGKAFKVRGFKGPIELAGVVHHPQRPAGKKLPLVVFLHGRHETCYKDKAATGDWPCKRGYKAIPSYRGYDYIGRRLASRGYVVVSISANGINAADGEDKDDGMTVRGLLTQKHLDLWKGWATRGGAPFGNRFRGAIDFNRVGTMGHSRGGEGVVRQYEINASKGRPYGVQAVLPLAPTDFRRRVLTGVPMATLLPYCDGDVSDLQGVHYYDDARYRQAGDPAAKHTVTVMGANHNFFNTVWSPSSRIPGASDDWSGANTSSCHPKAATRLSEADQRKAGLAYIAGFFRYYVGGEKAFAPLWRGETRPPASAGRAQVLISYQAPSSRRRDINRLLKEANLRKNTLGGEVTSSGLRLLELCGGPSPDRSSCLLRQSASFSAPEPHRSDPWDPKAPAGMSILMNGWTTGNSSLSNVIPAEAGDVSGFRAITFRAAQDFSDPRNSKGRPQDLKLTLTDKDGKKTSVDIATYAAALAYPPQGGGQSDVVPHFLLNQVRVPLSAFHGADLRNLRGVSLDYSVTRQGTIGLADFAFTD